MPRHEKSHAPGTPCWFDLLTPDVEAAAAFYAQVFGWTYDVGEAEHGHYHTATVDGRPAAGIGQREEGSQDRSAWTVHLAADDVEAMADRVTELGGSVLNGPMEVSDLGRLAIVQDPGGAVFGLWQPLGHDGFGVTHEHGTMGWCEVNVPDGEVAKAFYAELMGAEARRLESDAVPTVYYVLWKDDAAVAGILEMTAEWRGVPPHWMPYFEVDDCDAAARAAEAAGGTVSVQPFDTEYGRIAVVTDPFGAVFSVNRTTASR